MNSCEKTIQALKDRLRDRHVYEIVAKTPDDSTTAFAFTMPDAFLALMAEILEECDRELWNKLKVEHMVHSDPAR